jgi:hypothetical protein
MHEFRVYSHINENITYLQIEEGNINIEDGIRFVYSFLDYNRNTLERKTFVINGDDFARIGRSGKDTRIAIIELLLKTTSAIIVKE